MKRVLFLFILLLNGCVIGFYPIQEHAEYTPPEEFENWYNDVWNRCGRLVVSSPKYKYTDIKFYSVSGDNISALGKKDPIAITTHNRLYVVAKHIHNKFVIQHEFLHLMIKDSPFEHHPIFKQCGLAEY